MLIDKFANCRLVVVGDVMLDHFVGGVVERVSPEAPALVLRVEEERTMLGGAANVAANIVSLGGTVALVGVIGEDGPGMQLAALLQAHGGRIVDQLIRSDKARTVEKTRYIAEDRHLLRADRENDRLQADVAGCVINRMIRALDGCDAVLVSDYAKGVVSAELMQAAVEHAHARGVPVIADPKRRDFLVYRGADVLTPNTQELAFATGEACQDPSSCARAAASVIEHTGASILLTRSQDGVAVYQADREAWSEPAQTTSVRDVSGAGDTILAVTALSLAAGESLVTAAHVANVAAAIAIQKSGTASVTRDELNFALLHSPDTDTLSGKLVAITSARSVREAWRAQGLEVGFTNGCFDLLHPGHIALLKEARGICDRLIVAINTDESVRRLKGPERPVQSELARAAVIGAMRSVDLVLLFDDDTPLDLIAELTPNVLIKGADYTLDKVVGADLVHTWGGRVELVDLIPDASTSALIEASKGRTA